MNKRVLAFLLVLAMVFSVCPVQVLAENTETIVPGDVKTVTLGAKQQTIYAFVPTETAEYTFWNVGNSNSYYCLLDEDGHRLTNGNAYFAFEAKAGSVYEFTVINENSQDTVYELHLEKNVPADSVKMRSSHVVMMKGERRSFPLEFSPVNSIRGEYSWSLSDTDVATIASHFNSGCDVIGNAAGTTTLTVNVGGLQTSCEITVLDVDSMERLNVGDVKTLTLDPGETRVFRFDPTNTAQYTLWNELGFNGYFFTIYEGKSVIHNGNCPVAFQAKNGTAYVIHVRNEGMETATYEMHLEENVPMISVSMEEERSTVKGGGGFVALTYNPFNSIRSDVQWSVDDSSVVKLGSYFDGGCNFEAVGIGTATITAVAGGQTARCKITVFCRHENISNNICQDCGATMGDANGDGVVNMTDALQLLWQVVLSEESSVNGKVDVTGDGQVTEEDVAYVFWYSLFPDLYQLNGMGI